jgi:hypothetical protein
MQEPAPSTTHIYTMSRTENWKSMSLIAAGVLVSCTDPITNEHLFLFGVSTAHKLCNFHGFNDESRSKAPTAKTTPYNLAACRTAAREFAEESLEVVGSEKQMYYILSSTQGYFTQIFPEDSVNVRCYWVHMGYVGRYGREDIMNRFQLLRKNPSLKSCQKEVIGLVWVPASNLYAASQGKPRKCLRCVIESTAGGPQGGQQTVLAMREWLTGWILDIFRDNQADGGAKLFKQVCSGERKDIPLLPFTSL